MHQEIERIVEDYDRGRLSRREMIAHLGALAAAMALGATATAAEPSTFTATGLNHIALNTPDIPLARDFYIKHLGLRVTSDGPNSCFMSFGNNFIALFKSPNAGINHYCYSIENYNVRDAAEKLKAEGLNPRVAGNRIYFKDPHGLEVQLASKDHSA